ncbi:MAG: hypothetical protein AOA65_1677 [Candidatus Bathyarchaeota archaeon BA1]|nr:MAG: hypothetical protein AOA65_1677 [Candidatus Bathyarchaeota archaeon BA1]
MAYVEGIADVSILVPVCFDNPLKQNAVNFISDVLAQRRRMIIPVTAVMGAYHIATTYLRASRPIVKRILEGLLRTRSPALYPHVTPELAIDALDCATAYSVESWDGYLVALARSLGVKVVYSLDEELSKIKEMVAINPFPKDKVREYHDFIEHSK